MLTCWRNRLRKYFRFLLDVTDSKFNGIVYVSVYLVNDLEYVLSPLQTQLDSNNQTRFS